MSAKFKYTAERLGKVQAVPDFLPPPAELMFREEGVKVTLALSKRSDQRMIRRLLDAQTLTSAKAVGVRGREAGNVKPTEATVRPHRHRP